MAADTNLVELEQRREHAIATLSQRYAEDILDVDEYERRVELAQNAERAGELEELIADLAPIRSEQQALAVPTGYTLVPADQVPAAKSILAVFGSTKREGRWAVPRRVKVVAVFAESVLDLRQAQLAPGMTVIDLTVIMAEVVIVVPPGLRVQLEHASILAETANRADGTIAGPGEPVISIEGIVVMGEVRVDERLPGETKREAHKRLKAERKRRKQLEKERRALGPPD